mgnify:CR=1 FL=1
MLRSGEWTVADSELFDHNVKIAEKLDEIATQYANERLKDILDGEADTYLLRELRDSMGQLRSVFWSAYYYERMSELKPRDEETMLQYKQKVATLELYFEANPPDELLEGLLDLE